MEFLTNSQGTTLPLFLLMVSFAVVAGISDDIYRLANAVMGRVKGGLAYATVAGCAGFGAVGGSSIATLFVAAMGPAVLLYFGAIWVTVRSAGVHGDAADPPTPDPVLPALRSALPVVVLFGAVIGGLYGRVFTATKSAALGAVGAFLLATLRGRLNRHTFLSVMSETTATTALIFGALIFLFFVNISQAPDLLIRRIAGIDARPIVILAALILVVVMDSFAVMVITVPVVTPLVIGLGYDVYYWGVLMLVVVEIGLITPPFGINLFVLKSLQPEVRIGQVMRGVLPFLVADAVKIALLVAFPAIALWQPTTRN